MIDLISVVDCVLLGNDVDRATATKIHGTGGSINTAVEGEYKRRDQNGTLLQLYQSSLVSRCWAFLVARLNFF